MEELKSLKKELRRLDDMVDVVEWKIHNLIGLLELIYLGTKALNSVEDSYEMCSVSLMRSYLETLEKTDIQKLHDRLTRLKEQV